MDLTSGDERQPAIRAPWPALALAAAILGSYAAQRLSGDPGGMIGRFGVSRAGLDAGRWWSLVTSLFVHGGWAHAGLNAIGALAFGAPVARLFGTRAAGALAFFAFFLLCGAVASAGFALVHASPVEVAAGASGGVAGLMGASSRLLWRGEGTLAPSLSPTVVGVAVGWVIINLLMAVLGSGAAGMGDAPIAWEAHLFGYAMGLIGVGPAAWALRRR